jgi:hypothetical protein
MKSVFRKIFSPILNYFESGEDEFIYVRSHRIILLVVGVLFSVLASASAFAAILTAQFSAFIPVVIFFAAGAVCLIVSLSGNERAVATIWRSK